MKKFLIALMLVVSGATLLVTDADARRLGGGGSFGRQSGNVTRQQAMPPANNNYTNQARPAQPAAPAPMPAKPPSRWKGIVGGLIGGALLGAALSSLGFGGGMGSAMGSMLTFLMIGGVIFFLISMFRRKQESAALSAVPQSFSYGDLQPVRTPEIGSRLESAQTYGGAAQLPWNVPTDFDTAGFLRNAKSQFIRMQAAWDAGNINDIREFTTPEMFGEIRLQLQERGAQADVTDVVSIEAELLGIETVGSDYLASVKFTGTIKESATAPAEPFREVWNLSKPLDGHTGWLLAGIQQLP